MTLSSHPRKQNARSISKLDGKVFIARGMAPPQKAVPAYWSTHSQILARTDLISYPALLRACLAACRAERVVEMAPEKPEIVKASPFIDNSRKGTLLPSRTSTAGTGAPASFYCPISMELMADPVMVATGHTYDR